MGLSTDSLANSNLFDIFFFFFSLFFLNSPPTDGLVQAFDQHEDSVYQVAWSSVDPWLFMSLSHDGRAVMNQVPSEEKFKILLNY